MDNQSKQSGNSDSNGMPRAGIWFRHGSIITAILFFLILTLISFPKFMDTGKSLEASDAPLVWTHQVKMMLSQGVIAWSNPYQGLGAGAPTAFGEISLLAYLLFPEQKVDEALFVFSVFLSGFFFYLFLRDRKYSFYAALFGGIVFGFSTSLVSIVKAGHLGKFIGLAYLSAAMWLMNRGFQRDRWGWIVWAAWCIGCSLAWAKDNTVIILAGIGLFWLKEVLVALRSDFRIAVRRGAYLFMAAVLSVVIAWPYAVDFLPSRGKSAISIQEDPRQKWEWATQWSLPGDELIKLTCPGYLGWDSWDSVAPYWGRMGRSAEWERTRQGFRNFTQTNEYLGIVAVIFALIGAGSFLRLKTRQAAPEQKSEMVDTIFWMLLGLVALDCAMGKYGFLYKCLYQMPLFSSIRNPVKFMHVVNIAVAVLGAKGIGLLESVMSERDRPWRFPSLLTLGVPFLLFLVFTGMMVSSPWLDSAFLARLSADGYEAQKSGIQSAMQSGVLRCIGYSIVLVIVIAVFQLLRRQSWMNKGHTVCLVVVLAMLAIDFSGVNSRYINYYDPAAVYQSNPVIDYIRESPEYRTKFIPLSFGIFNQWNTLLVPYYGIRSADVSSDSRPAQDKQAFYSSFSQVPGRMWELMGVRYFVIPRELEQQLMSILGSQAKAVRNFDFAPGSHGAPTVQMQASANAGRFLLINSQNALSSIKWYGYVESMSFEKALKRLSDPSFDPQKTVLLDEKDTGRVSLTGFGNTGGTGKVSLVEYGMAKIRATSVSSSDGWILINDYYDGRWKAFVDGKEAPVIRANGVFRAIPVKAGLRSISLSYKGNVAGFWVLAVSLFILSILTIISVLKTRIGCRVR